MKKRWLVIVVVLLSFFGGQAQYVSTSHEMDLETAIIVQEGEYHGTITDQSPYLIFNFTADMDSTYTFKINIDQGRLLLYKLYDAKLNLISESDTSQFSPIVHSGENKYIIVLSIDSRFSSDYDLIIKNVSNDQGITQENALILKLGENSVTPPYEIQNMYFKFFTNSSKSYLLEELSAGKKHEVQIFADGNYFWGQSSLYKSFKIAGFDNYALIKLSGIESFNNIVLRITELNEPLYRSIISNAIQIKDGEQRVDLLYSNVPLFANFTGISGKLYMVNVFPIDNPTLFAANIQLLNANGTVTHKVHANLQYKQVFGLIGGVSTVIRFYAGSTGGFRVSINEISNTTGRTYGQAIRFTQQLNLEEIYANMPYFINVTTIPGTDYLVQLKKLYIAHINLYLSETQFEEIKYIQNSNLEFSRQFWFRSTNNWAIIKLEPLFYLDSFKFNLTTIELDAPDYEHAERLTSGIEQKGGIEYEGIRHWYTIDDISNLPSILEFEQVGSQYYEVNFYDHNLVLLQSWPINQYLHKTILSNQNIRYIAIAGEIGNFTLRMDQLIDTEGLVFKDPYHIQSGKIFSVYSEYDLSQLFVDFTPSESGQYIITLGTGNQRIISIKEATRPGSVPITTVNTVELVKDVKYVFSFQTQRGVDFEILLRGPFPLPVTAIYSDELDVEDRFGWRVELNLNGAPMLPGTETFAGADTLSIELTDTIRELPVSSPYTAFDMKINGNPISRFHSDYFELEPSMLILPLLIRLDDNSEISLNEAINRQVISYSPYFAVADAYESNSQVFIDYTSENQDTQLVYSADIGVLSSFYSKYSDSFGNEYELSLDLRAVGISINTQVSSSTGSSEQTKDDSLFTVPFPFYQFSVVLMIIPLVRSKSKSK